MKKYIPIKMIRAGRYRVATNVTSALSVTAKARSGSEPKVYKLWL